MNKRLILLLLLSFSITTAVAEPTTPATNKDGSIVTGVLTAGYDPLNGVFPFPFNLMFLDTTDLTLNPPVDDPNDYSDPTVALSTLDGFSTTEKWTTEFFGNKNLLNQRGPGQIDPASVIPGLSVRVFQVTTAQIVFVTGIVRELVPGVDYVAVAATESIIAIIPLKPLPELSSFMAVLTNDIKDPDGNDATPDQTYWLTKRRTPWVDENGNSTYPLVPDATAQSLEPQRQITQSMEGAAATAGINPDDIILSWTVQTQSITPVLKNLRSIAKPAPTTVGPTGLNTSAIGGAGIADIYAGIITLPYYLGVPSASNPIAPLTDFWTAAPGAYVPPFDAFGLDPTSTNITVANPFPVLTDMQTVPLLMTVPNAASGQTRPAAGWPVVSFGHSLTGNRTHMLAVADTLALIGYAVVAIDFPLHGIVPEDPQFAPLYIGNSPWVDVANERTFDVDYINNETGAPGRDGITDPSGTHLINLTSMLTSRDNFRQGEADLSVLAVTIPSISYNGDALPDLDGSTVQYASLSLGSIIGTPFTAVEPMVTNAFLSVPMGGIARGLEASDELGPRIRAGLAAVGLEPGTADYEGFFTVFQTVLDSADAINWSVEAAGFNNILLHEVIGDTVFPNFVLTAPLSGTEPMIKAMGLESYSSTQSNPGGLDAAGRFLPPASHPSLISPATSPAATVEMQKQMASFIATRGTTVVVEDASTMVPVAAPAAEAEQE
jgi:hypothetical protein